MVGDEEKDRVNHVIRQPPPVGEARASNVAAIAMYEMLGFTRFNVRARYYADGEDAVEMELRLA